MRYVIISILAILVIATVVMLNINASCAKGFIGEFIVKKKLKRIEKNYYLLSNVIIPGQLNTSSQIDHIYITRKGIFVIEVKNYNGTIYGRANATNWTQYIGKSIIEFYSPLKQNQTHVERLSKILNNDVPIYNIVLFVKDNLKIETPNVMYYKKFKKYYNKLSNYNGNASLIDCYESINNYKIHKIMTNKQHVQHIKNNENNIRNNICPSCGGRLVLVNGKYGEYYRCSNYPKCKFSISKEIKDGK